MSEIPARTPNPTLYPTVFNSTIRRQARSERDSASLVEADRAHRAATNRGHAGAVLRVSAAQVPHADRQHVPARAALRPRIG